MGTPSNDGNVVIARVVKARGIRGEVACDIETDYPGRFAELKQVALWMPDGSTVSLVLKGYRFHKDRVILKFEGVDTMNDARKLLGGRLVIPEDAPRKLEEGEFFEYDIVGSAAVTTGGELLGIVVELMRTGGASVLVVKGDGGHEYLIPFVDGICTGVDVRAKRITVDPPEGLLEL